MHASLRGLALAVGLLTAACGTATPSAPPAASQSPATSQPPSTSPPSTDKSAGSEAPGGPGTQEGDVSQMASVTDEDINPPLQPLPDPELTTTDEIAETLFDPTFADQAVVSMLQALQIGTYTDEGQPIHPGNEASDNDFYLTQSEVYGLIDMEDALATGEGWVPFSDYYEALQSIGLQSSLEELAQAYQESYAEQPDAPIVRFIQGTGAIIDPQAQIPPLGIWLMFLDGLVPPNGSSQPIASVGGYVGAPSTSFNWGAAQKRVKSLNWGSALAQQSQILDIMAIVRNTTVMVEPDRGEAHEGHGGTGDPKNVTAIVSPGRKISPFTGANVLQVRQGTLQGITVTWQYDAGLTGHGTAVPNSGATNTTDASGKAVLVFTPKQEKANGRGYVVRQIASISASVSADQVAQQVYGTNFNLGKVTGKQTLVSGAATMGIAWHEPSAIHISLTNGYDATLKNELGGNAHSSGLDTFDGVLVQDDEGLWSGTVFAMANGNFTGQFAGLKPCTFRWSVRQVLQVFGENRSGPLPGEDPLTPTGDFNLTFFPATQALGPTGGRNCHADEFPAQGGLRYAPYNDTSIANFNTGLTIKLPPKPGGTDIYHVASDRVHGATLKNTSWQVTIEYLDPP